MGGGKGILGVILWCSVLFMVDFPCMIGICGLYIASYILMLSLVIGQFLILFFSTASFSVCVGVHTTSCWSILDFSAPLVSCWWKYALLFSVVFIKF